MRRALLAALVLTIGTALNASAQPVFGLRASGIYTTALSSGTSLGDAVGLGVGAFVEAPVTPTLSVIMDVGYAQGGAGDDVAITSPTLPDLGSELARYRYRTHVLTVAPALTATLRTGDIEPYLFVGPRLDVKMAERLRFTGPSAPSDDFPDAAIGLAGGGGIAAGRILLDLRASYLFGTDNRIRQSAGELRLGVAL